MSRITFNQEQFEKDFMKGRNKTFQHNQHKVFHLFPYTTRANGVSSFDHMMGALIRALYHTKAPKKVDKDSVIQGALAKVSTQNEGEKKELSRIIEKVYFDDQNRLNCHSIYTYEYCANDQREDKLAEFLVSVLCEPEQIKELIQKNKTKNANLLDQIVFSSLPALEENTKSAAYYNLNPFMRRLFTDDVCFLLRQGSFSSADVLNLLSYYYFYYVSRSMLRLDEELKESDVSKSDVYYCLAWEKTSNNRKCYHYGWRKIERTLSSMLTHAVLLDILNHFDFGKLCSYQDIYQLYQDGDEDMRVHFYSQLLALKHNYENEYVKDVTVKGVDFEPDPEYGDLAGLIRAFFNNMKMQFFYSERDSVNKKYPKNFSEFARNNFLQNRGRNGLMLALDEEQIILLTKIVIKDGQRMKLNDLMKGFEQRGIYFDHQSKQALISFYDTLGLIEKKSDSGDAKYVKGIL